MANLKDWDFFNLNVQGGLIEGRFLNAAYTLIAAGPPRLATTSLPATSGELTELPNIAFPVGVVQSLNIGQSAQIMRIWEIGSERSYFIRGRTMGNLGLGRIMFHGPNLLRVLYAYLGGQFSGAGTFEALYENTAKAHLNTNEAGEEAKTEFALPPGYENLWLDLASDVFSQPIGLLVMLKDSNKATVGAFYLEYCHITNHGMATDAGGTILTENCSILYERMIPINVQAVQLVKDSSSIVGTVISGRAVGSPADGA